MLSRKTMMVGLRVSQKVALLVSFQETMWKLVFDSRRLIW